MRRVASSPLPGGPRHVGRVIDPSAREDGELEPALELEAQESLDAGSPGGPPNDPPTTAQLRGASLRERLLKRASEVQTPTQQVPEQKGLEQSYADLDRVGMVDEPPQSKRPSSPTGRAPSAPMLLDGRTRLSPSQHAFFVTLLGIAMVASLIALAINVDDHGAGLGLAAKPASSQAMVPPAPAPTRPKRVREKLPGPWRIADAQSDPNLRLVEGEVGNQAFLNALEKAGIAHRERYRILTSMKGIRSFDRCKKTDRFLVLLEKQSGRVNAFEYVASRSEVYQSREAADGLLKGTRLDLKVSHNQVTGSLLYDGESFDASAERVGFDPGLRKVVAKALDGHLEMDEIERGDRLRLAVQEQTVLGEFASYTGVEVIEIQPAGGKRSPIRIYYFDRPSERGYYDAEGRAPYEGGWRKPIKDAPITSPFNMKRMHPVLKKVMPHTGIDFGAETGTPVGAASFGTVSFIGYSGPSGNLVKIEHPGGVETGYAHLSRFAEGLKVGDRVRRLGVVGYVGSTGRSTGPHLHFSARRDGKFFDPMTLKFDAMRIVSKEARSAFLESKAKYDALLDTISLPEPLPEEKDVAPKAPGSAAGHDQASSEGAIGVLDSEDDEPDAMGPGAAPSAGPADDSNQSDRPQKSMVHLTDQEILELSRSAGGNEIQR